MLMRVLGVSEPVVWTGYPSTSHVMWTGKLVVGGVSSYGVYWGLNEGEEGVDDGVKYSHIFCGPYWRQGRLQNAWVIARTMYVLGNSNIKTTTCALGKPIVHEECVMTFELYSVSYRYSWDCLAQLCTTGKCLSYMYTHIHIHTHWSMYECMGTWLYENMSVRVHMHQGTRCMAMCVHFSSQSH